VARSAYRGGSWEQLQEFQDLYPAFQLEDKLFVEGGEML